MITSRSFCLPDLSPPSEVEGFGISVIEAAAAGVPYVVSDIPVLKEVTRNGQGGLIAKVGDIAELSQKLEKLITDKKLYAEKSKQAIHLAKSYQWPQIARLTESVYTKAVR